MYGTVARLRIKPGMEDTLLNLTGQFRADAIAGIVGEWIYRMDADPTEFYMCVAFASKEAYHANANSPEQHQRYEQFRALLAADPEWHDGEIVWAHP